MQTQKPKCIGSCRRCQQLPGSASSQPRSSGYDSAAFRYSPTTISHRDGDDGDDDDGNDDCDHGDLQNPSSMINHYKFQSYFQSNIKVIIFKVTFHRHHQEKVRDLTIHGPLPFLSVTAQFSLCWGRGGGGGGGLLGPNTVISNTLRHNIQ